MKRSIRYWLLSLTLSCAASADEPPLTPEQVDGAQVEPLELDTLEVVGGLTVQQEAALRIVRQALDEPRSFLRKNFDKWRCWFERPLGTRLQFLHCARNGDLWALQPRGAGGSISANDLTPTIYGDYGRVLVSSRPMTEAKMRRMLGNAVGSEENDDVFIEMVLAGQTPPKDVPSLEELERFSEAWSSVDSMSRRGVGEDRQIAAIESSGLSLNRYNRIAELVEDFPYIHDQVAARVAE
jgi:hypothetical protein